jgi:glycosyltransferase involved in cell wall biosynthesis
MKNLFFCHVHQAPYVDRLTDLLKDNFILTDIFYDKSLDSEKSWIALQNRQVKTLNPKNFLKLLRGIAKSDLVFVAGWGSVKMISIIFIAKLFGKTTVVSSDYPVEITKSRIKFYFKFRLLFPMIDYFLCATESTMEHLCSFYKIDIGKLKFFPYVPDYPSELKYYSTRTETGKLVIFVASNFLIRKGYHILFEAIDLLIENGLLGDYIFYIAGTGLSFDEYSRKYTNFTNVVFLGWVEYEHYINYLNKCDVLIHPSINEPFGIPPVDAMLRGKLVIVSDGVESTRNLLKNGINGYVYEKYQVQELFCLIKNLRFLNLHEIGNRGRNDAMEYFGKIKFNIVLKSLK